MASLHKTFTPAENAEQARNEVDDSIKFDLTLVTLIIKAERKEKISSEGDTNNDKFL